MQKGSGGDDDGRAVRMFDGGPVLHDGTDVHHVFPVLVDGAAQQADERLVGHDLLGDGALTRKPVSMSALLEPLRSMGKAKGQVRFWLLFYILISSSILF